MSSRLLGLYHRLPPALRTLAASARGLQLRAWRYGPETDPLAAEAREREHWRPEQWQAWREERLAFVLARAARQVPYYREQWAARRRRGDRASWELLANWPVLEKEALRRETAAFVAEDCDRRRMFHEHTSGTSGTSLDLWWSRATVRTWYAWFEARCRGWYGVSRHDRWAMLGGQLVTPVSQRRPPFWVWNAGLRQLYCSAYHLAPDLIPYYLDALARYRVRYLWGYSSALHALAEGALQHGYAGPPLAVAVSNAEPLLAHQREAIRAGFGCPVRETYGMAEIVTAANECDAGQLHLWPEAGIVEVVAGEQALPAGTAGDLICTGLLNADMPLIRYRVGDRGALAPAEQRCGCGRSLPLLASVEGRRDDTLYTVDGRRVGRLDPVFKARLPVREAQIIQERLDRVRVRYVPAPDFNAAAGASLVERLQERLGPVEVVLEPVEAIPRGPGGKFRAVICALPPEQRREIEGAPC